MTPEEKETGPIVDLAEFPITAKHIPVDGLGKHTVRGRAICEAVTQALALPGIEVDEHVNYATLSFCGSPGGDNIAVEYRIRINGFGFGKGSKKTIEYLAISFVALSAEQATVGWTEDLQGFRGTPAYWAAVNAGKPPPKLKSNPKDCGLLTFVGEDKKGIPISEAIRSRVASIAPKAPEAPAGEKKTEGKSKTKKSSIAASK